MSQRIETSYEILREERGEWRMVERFEEEARNAAEAEIRRLANHDPRARLKLVRSVFDPRRDLWTEVVLHRSDALRRFEAQRAGAPAEFRHVYVVFQLIGGRWRDVAAYESADPAFRAYLDRIKARPPVTALRIFLELRRRDGVILDRTLSHEHLTDTTGALPRMPFEETEATIEPAHRLLPTATGRWWVALTIALCVALAVIQVSAAIFGAVLRAGAVDDSMAIYAGFLAGVGAGVAVYRRLTRRERTAPAAVLRRAAAAASVTGMAGMGETAMARPMTIRERAEPTIASPPADERPFVAFERGKSVLAEIVAAVRADIAPLGPADNPALARFLSLIAVGGGRALVDGGRARPGDWPDLARVVADTAPAAGDDIATWCWQSVPTLPPYDEVIALGHRLVGRAIGADGYDTPAMAADIAAARFLDIAATITELPDGCLVLVQRTADDSLSIVSILDEEASRRGRDFTRLSRDPDEDGMIHYWATGLDPAIAALRQACRLADKQRLRYGIGLGVGRLLVERGERLGPALDLARAAASRAATRRGIVLARIESDQPQPHYYKVDHVKLERESFERSLIAVD